MVHASEARDWQELIFDMLCCGAPSAKELDSLVVNWISQIFVRRSLVDADLSTAESIRGADFTGASDLDLIREVLLSRPFQELDCWNPLTRRATRDSLKA